MVTLTRILRRVELASQDPHHAIREEVTASPLDGARNLATVLYSRIRTEYRDRFDQAGASITDWARL